jgi:hypothetical protein
MRRYSPGAPPAPVPAPPETPETVNGRAPPTDKAVERRSDGRGECRRNCTCGNRNGADCLAEIAVSLTGLLAASTIVWTDT